MLFAWSACRRTDGDLLDWLVRGFLWSLAAVHRRDRHVVDLAPRVARRHRGPGGLVSATGVDLVRRAAAAGRRAPTPSSRRRRLQPLADLDAAVRAALAAPLGAPRLRELARGARSVVVTIPDASRPCPNEPVLDAPCWTSSPPPACPDDAVTVAIGCGLHATTGAAERDRLAGAVRRPAPRGDRRPGHRVGARRPRGDVARRPGPHRPPRRRRRTSSSPSASSSRTCTPGSPAA